MTQTSFLVLFKTYLTVKNTLEVEYTKITRCNRVHDYKILNKTMVMVMRVSEISSYKPNHFTVTLLNGYQPAFLHT